MRIGLFIVFFLFFLSAVSNGFEAQTINDLKTENKVLVEQYGEIKNQPEQYIYHNKVWSLLRFCEVPTDFERNKMLESGIVLHQYQPDLIWFASIPVGISVHELDAVGVCEIVSKPISKKMDQRIFYNRIPEYAEDERGINANIIVAASEDYSAFQSSLEEHSILIESVFEPLGILKVNASLSNLKLAAKLPFVVFVELPEPPAELEIEDEVTLSRNAYVNGYYNLDGLNGSGVKIAVNEGGIMDSLYQPNFKNRSDRSLENGNVSGHKTNVARRMASAGNINPIHRGPAWGAEIASGGINFTRAAQSNINIVNNSFGYGCIPTGATYNSGAATNDFLVRNYERFMITYSCGNIGGSACSNYGAGSGWGNITGLVKSAKNIFAVGAMTTDDQLTGFSSRGPAMDGRILPDITAPGPGGTSYASPSLAGTNAILTQGYRNKNGNQWPNSGLIKAIILNTADDIENIGPDYKTGFGRVNAIRALEVINNNQFLTDSVSNGSSKSHSISVPAGVSQLKVMVYWTDREATPGITGKTLINNLDLRVLQPSGGFVNPWVLNPFPDPDSLNAPAKRGTDTLNNVELVTINSPTAGSYNVEVSGSLVPFGPQMYQVVYSYVYDSINVAFPKGGEGLVPNENRRIRWDAYDTAGTFTISYSVDSGINWRQIASGIKGNLRTHNWSIPDSVSGNCFVKVANGSTEGQNEKRFSIAKPPTNLDLVWRCADSAMFSWDTVSNALGYWVYKLGVNYMDTVLFTTDSKSILYNLSLTEEEWVSVQTVLPDSGASRRAVAISIQPSDFNCVPFDLSMNKLISPEAGFVPSCLASDSMDLVLLVKNNGVQPLNYIPIAFQINGGNVIRDTVFTLLGSASTNQLVFEKTVLLAQGTNTIRAWTNYPGDANRTNDSLEFTIEVYTGISATLPYTQNFDNFTNCSTAWGCASVSCNLTQGWFNIPNTNGADSIDWRTHTGKTGTGNTGPSGDHTNGSGKYLYLEGSGNGGGGCTNKEAKAYSPCFDLTGTNQATISYWYHAFGGGIGSLHLDVYADGHWHIDVAQPISGAQGNQWLQQTASLSEFVDKEIIVRFRGKTGNGFASDLAIDDINLTTLPLVNHEAAFDTFCLNQHVTFLNSTSYANSYKWTFSPSTFRFSNGSSASPNPMILPSDTGWYSAQLEARNTTGLDTLIITKSFYVKSNTSPVISTSGSNSDFCFGDSAVFSVESKGGVFEFFENSNLVQTGLDTSWLSSSPKNGDKIQVVNLVNPNCSLSSAMITVNILPDLDGKLLSSNDADLVICEGDTVIISTEGNLGSYRFYESGTLISAGTDSSISTYLLINGSRVYAEIENSIGCTGVTDTISWTVNPIPATPSILAVGIDSLQSSIPANTYNWSFSGTPLIDSTKTIVASQNGSYSLQIGRLGCYSSTSGIYDYEKEIVIGSINDFEAQGIMVFPNPASGSFNIMLKDDSSFKLNLYNALGELIIKQDVNKVVNTINIDELAAGIYSLLLTDSEKNIEFKLVVE